MEDWTEKYRPQRLSDIIGNEKAIASIIKWARQWQNNQPPKQKAVILAGKPGTGKTSTAYALAHDFRWIPIELNASDARNASKIKMVATSGALNETFDDTGQFIPIRKGGRKLIILDEADNLYERTERTGTGSDYSDKGGKKEIVETIKKTNQPIILIVNDYYQLIKGSGEALKHLCINIRYYDVFSSAIIELLKRICREEGIIADKALLQTIADRSKGDVRSAVNDLQSLSCNKKQLTIEALDVLGYRDQEKIIFDALRDIFKQKNIKSIKDNLTNLNETPELLILWINENLPKEYRSPNDLVTGYNFLSQADLFLGRVMKRQHYGLWAYASDLMSGGVATAKNHEYGNDRYNAPNWFKVMREQRTSTAYRTAIIQKLAPVCHNSERKTKESILPSFTYMFCNNLHFACKMKIKLDLSENEIKFLLGKEHAHKLKQIVLWCEKTDEKQGEIPLDTEKEKTKKEIQPEQKEIRQQSIFDF